MNQALSCSYHNAIVSELSSRTTVRDVRGDLPVLPVGSVPFLHPVRSVLPVRGVRPVPPPTKRVMKSRHPFDIYQDQYIALQQLALEERKQGDVGSMSAMVREAIDKIIAERTQQKRS